MITQTLSAALARQFFKTMGVIVDEFRLVITPDGWKAAAVDPANVAMVKIDLPQLNFTTIEAGNIIAGVGMEKIKQFIAGMDDTEVFPTEEYNAPVRFEWNKAPDKQNGPDVRYERYRLKLTQGMFMRDILLPPEKEIRKQPKVPEIPWEYKIQARGSELKLAVRKAGKVSDYVKFCIHQGKANGTPVLQIIALDDEEDLFTAVPTIQYLLYEAEAACRERTVSMFSSDYLRDIMAVIPEDSEVIIHIGQDFPIQIMWQIGSTGRIEYIQAPRVESE